MKYIRTKDGRIIKILKEGTDNFGKYGMLDKENRIRNYDDLKQADTIEELCDGYIVEEKGKKDNWFVMSIYEFKQMDLKDRQYLVKGWNYYGYIKTDKGLIYVAKMNEKGELELL